MGMHDRDYYKDWHREKQQAELQNRLRKLKVQRRTSPAVMVVFWAVVVLALWAAFKFFRHH